MSMLSSDHREKLPILLFASGSVPGGLSDFLGFTGSRFNLFEWIRPRFTIASTEAIYGPGNPYKVEPEIGQGFW